MKRIILALLCLSYLLLPLTSKAQTDEERLQQVLYYYTHLEGYQADFKYIFKSGYDEIISPDNTLSLTPSKKRIDSPSSVSIITAFDNAFIDFNNNLITVMDSHGENPDKLEIFTFWKKDYEIIEGSSQILNGKTVYLIILKAEKDQDIRKVKLYLDGKRIIAMSFIGRDFSIEEYLFSNEKINPVFEEDWFFFNPFRSKGMRFDDYRQD